jgi:hypothetical protein
MEKVKKRRSKILWYGALDKSYHLQLDKISYYMNRKGKKISHPDIVRIAICKLYDDLKNREIEYTNLINMKGKER